MSAPSDQTPVRVAINGLGRIGRMVLRLALRRSTQAGDGVWRGRPARVVAANDVASASQLAYLIGHDSVHGRWPDPVEAEAGALRVGGESIALHQAVSPDQIPWEGVDVVVECSGHFVRRPELEGHLRGDVRAVLLGSPGEVDQTIVVGVNEHTLDPRARVLSAASCTTNAVAPVLAVLHEAFGVRWGLIGTVHAQTAGQSVVDGAARDLRRGRAAGHNIIPTTTGAVRAVAHVLPALAGKIDGHSVRVPVVDGSLFDVTCTLGDTPGLERVLDVLRTASADPRMRGILDVRRAPLVSSDIVGDLHSSIVDEGASLASGPLVRVVGWYDNEAAYAARLLDLVSVWGDRRDGGPQ